MLHFSQLLNLLLFLMLGNRLSSLSGLVLHFCFQLFSQSVHRSLINFNLQS